jgi:hypothetical protein
LHSQYCRAISCNRTIWITNRARASVIPTSWRLCLLWYQ